MAKPSQPLTQAKVQGESYALGGGLGVFLMGGMAKGQW